jgi:hypothetical protein
MCGTEVVVLFLKRRVQPVMSRSHQLWMYTDPNDKTQIKSADFTESELRDEVRRLTCFSQEDTIAMMSAQSPYGIRHLPSVVIFVT